MPERLHFTGDDAADTLLAKNPLALLIGFALDQQVTVPTAFSGPRKLEQRLGGLDAAAIAGMDPASWSRHSARSRRCTASPATWRGACRSSAATIVSEYGGDAARVWTDAADDPDLRRRIESLPGFGPMKVKALGSVLAKRFGVATAQGLVPDHPTLGDVDSAEALERYQAAKREYKAKLRAQAQA